MTSLLKKTTGDSVLLALFLLLGFATPLWSLADEMLFVAKYKGEFSKLSATSTRRLIQKDNGELVFFSIAENSFAEVSERSWFNLEDNKIIPTHYKYHRKVFGFKREEQVSFDWKSLEGYYKNKSKRKKNKTHRLAEGMLDSSLYQLQLQRDLYAGKKDGLEYEFIKRNKVKKMKFEIASEEPFKIGKRKYQAIKLQRVNLEDRKKTFVWVIPEFNYQIAKILHIEENGDIFKIRMTSYKASPKLITVFHQPNIGSFSTPPTSSVSANYE